MANIQPNEYVLQSNNGNIKVTYETTGLLGQPILNLTQSPGPVRHFTGSQIRAVNTEIGTFITVTTQLTVDTGSTSFSILIPAVSLNSISSQQAFTTEAVVTHHTGPNSIPSTGVHETYQFIPMKGAASFVLTLIEPITSALALSAKT